MGKPALKEIAEEGMDWAIRNGYANRKDKERTEEKGSIKSADFSKVSEDAFNIKSNSTRGYYSFFKIKCSCPSDWNSITNV